MVTPTPLRLVAIEGKLQAEDDGRADPITEQDLVAIEESPPAGDDESANPVAMMTEHDAITRKVPDPANVAAPEGFRTIRGDSRVADSAAHRCGRPRARGGYRCVGDEAKEHTHSGTGQRCPYTGSQRRGAVATPAIIGSARTGCRFTCSGARCPRYHPHRGRG